MRWARALNRAKSAGIQVVSLDHERFVVTSATVPGIAYVSTETACGCPAAQRGDSVCLHRAAVRDQMARQTCSNCAGSGYYASALTNWDGVRCECQNDPKPEPPAPAVSSLERELADATEALAKIDDLLVPFNESIEYGDGKYAYQHRHKHDALLSLREIAQQRVWDTADALKAQQTATAA